MSDYKSYETLDREYRHLNARRRRLIHELNKLRGEMASHKVLRGGNGDYVAEDGEPLPYLLSDKHTDDTKDVPLNGEELLQLMVACQAIHAFRWAHTPQGHAYWSRVHEELDELLHMHQDWVKENSNGK